jgi:1-acyl-sn-glycerol-3-phosphate acyltransferase
MLQPNAEQLALLTRVERWSYRFGDLASCHSDVVAVVNDSIMRVMIGLCGGRRLRMHGLSHLARFGASDSLILVANHRSFFDFYIVSATMFWHTDLPRRMFFPVRGTFFYDHPLGPFVNAAMSGMRMFPPILRERERGAWNLFSVARCAAELSVPGTIMGLHPEGTRNKGDDPYTLLPAQSGVGKIVLDAKQAHVIPIFVHGLSNAMGRELAYNWGRAPSEHPIDVVFGPEVDLGELRARRTRAVDHKRAANLCLDAVARLAMAHRDGAFEPASSPRESTLTPRTTRARAQHAKVAAHMTNGAHAGPVKSA